jgi:hypothetical protein
VSTRRLVVACLIGSYLLAISALGGAIVSAIRFEHNVTRTAAQR